VRATFFSLSRELFDLHLIPGTFRSAGGGRSRKKDGQARGYRHRNESSASSHSDEDMERSDDESSVGGGGGHRRDRPRRDSQSSRVSVQVREKPGAPFWLLRSLPWRKHTRAFAKTGSGQTSRQGQGSLTRRLVFRAVCVLAVRGRGRRPRRHGGAARTGAQNAFFEPLIYL
jgi:hypothetical protein